MNSAAAATLPYGRGVLEVTLPCDQFDCMSFSEGQKPELSALLREDADALLEEGREIARTSLAATHFTLPDDVRRDLEKIYRRGVDAVRALPG